MVNQDPLLSDKQVGEYLGCHRASVWRWVAIGRLDPPITVGERLKRWRQSTIDRNVQQWNVKDQQA